MLIIKELVSKEDFKETILELIESKDDSPNLNWSPENFMSFLGYISREIQDL